MGVCDDDNFSLNSWCLVSFRVAAIYYIVDTIAAAWGANAINRTTQYIFP